MAHFDAGVRHWLVQLTSLFGEVGGGEGPGQVPVSQLMARCNNFTIDPSALQAEPEATSSLVPLHAAG
jgi:hypothetical protein